LPVSLQLKEQLRQLIDRGSLPPGSKLPSVRELAGFLRINRNTVLRALAELEREGYVNREQGRGVFVRTQPAAGTTAQALAALVEETLARAREAGVAPGDLALGLLSRPPTAETSSAKTLLLVECNRPALRLYGAELNKELRVPVEAMLVKELSERAVDRNFAGAYRLVVTTFFHVEEVDAICARHRLPVVGLLPQASLDTLSRLIALPAATAVGIVCEDQEGIENMLQSLHRAGVTRLHLLKARLDQDRELSTLIRASELIVTTKECAAQLRVRAPEARVLVEDGGLDRSGIELLRRMLGS
jgi:DNA-binding transcriptional regulator YhcF (GntR family)